MLKITQQIFAHAAKDLFSLLHKCYCFTIIFSFFRWKSKNYCLRSVISLFVITVSVFPSVRSQHEIIMKTLIQDSFEQSLSSATRVFQLFGLQLFTLKNSNKNKEFNHRGRKISIKFKIIFMINLVILMIFTGTLAFLGSASDDLKGENSIYVFGLVIAIVLMVHTFIYNSKTKMIFQLMEDIGKIFEHHLNLSSDYSGLNRRFTKFNIVVNVILISVYISGAAFNFFFENLFKFYISLLKLSSYYILGIHLLRFVFYTLLVSNNLTLMQKAVNQLRTANRKISKYNRTNDEHFKINSLKAIYGMIWEMNELINSVSGPTTIYFFLLTIVINSINGYRVFLIFMQDIPMKAAIGLTIFNSTSKNLF